ncbi:DUF1496 domain-containing protein [Photobacterium sp. MCCC 1A19761]|uniref:DUF1496 domain-containing protein n=1 Tax=Photobacterium sp. MCCC 1A19761 TaxID=3115000 RepID=UPI00307ECE85
MRMHVLDVKAGSLLLGVLAGTAVPVAAAQQTHSTVTPKVEIQPKGVDHRICWYGGKEYSQGAILIVGKTQLQCQPENQFETNGRLSWHPLVQPSSGNPPP